MSGAGVTNGGGRASVVVDFEKSLSKHTQISSPHSAMRKEAARAAARAASPASSRVCHPVTTTPQGGFASSSSSFAKSKTKRARKPRDPPPGTTTSIAGDATREYLVKLPAQEMAAGLDEAQSSMRTRLITLTSVGAAVYLGYYIFPLVGASNGTTWLPIIGVPSLSPSIDP